MPNEIAASMEAVRVQIEGITASFRYPHFLIGRQPTYSMPPPSTVFGQIAGALGEFPNPADLQFAYTFSCERSRVDDLELIWFVEPNTATQGKTKDYNLYATSNVLPREWLIRPRMTLYVKARDLDRLYHAFREPRYTPTLGRSQDLVSYRRVDRVRLHPRTEGRFDSSLVPIEFRERLPFGASVLMPRFIDPGDRRNVTWAWYITLDQPVSVGPGARFEPQTDEVFWADPDARSDTDGRERLLAFHSFTDGSRHSPS